MMLTVQNVQQVQIPIQKVPEFFFFFMSASRKKRDRCFIVRLSWKGIYAI